jgi:hypothetical protein
MSASIEPSIDPRMDTAGRSVPLAVAIGLMVFAISSRYLRSDKQRLLQHPRYRRHRLNQPFQRLKQ